MRDQTFEKLISSESLVLLESFTLVLNHLEGGFLVESRFIKFLFIDTNLLEHLFVVLSDAHRILCILSSLIEIYRYRIPLLRRLTLACIVFPIFAVEIARSL